MTYFAYNADISVGDIWSLHLKNQNIELNAVICKNEKGAPTHNNTSAKSRAAR